MKKLYFIILIMLLSLLTACTKGPFESETDTIIPTITSSTPALTSPSPTQYTNVFEYSAMYSSRSGSYQNCDGNKYIFNDLTSFLDQYTDYSSDNCFDSEILFTNKALQNAEYTINPIDIYNEDFFIKNTLILYIFVESSSVSTYHKVQNVSQNNDIVNINVNGYIPSPGLPASKTCYIFIEIPKNHELISDNLNFIFDYSFLEENIN